MDEPKKPRKTRKDKGKKRGKKRTKNPQFQRGSIDFRTIGTQQTFNPTLLAGLLSSSRAVVPFQPQMDLASMVQNEFRKLQEHQLVVSQQQSVPVGQEDENDYEEERRRAIDEATSARIANLNRREEEAAARAQKAETRADELAQELQGLSTSVAEFQAQQDALNIRNETLLAERAEVARGVEALRLEKTYYENKANYEKIIATTKSVKDAKKYWGSEYPLDDLTKEGLNDFRNELFDDYGVPTRKPDRTRKGAPFIREFAQEKPDGMPETVAVEQGQEEGGMAQMDFLSTMLSREALMSAESEIRLEQRDLELQGYRQALEEQQQEFYQEEERRIAIQQDFDRVSAELEAERAKPPPISQNELIAREARVRELEREKKALQQQFEEEKVQLQQQVEGFMQEYKTELDVRNKKELEKEMAKAREDFERQIEQGISFQRERQVELEEQLRIQREGKLELEKQIAIQQEKISSLNERIAEKTQDLKDFKESGNYTKREVEAMEKEYKREKDELIKEKNKALKDMKYYKEENEKSEAFIRKQHLENLSTREELEQAKREALALEEQFSEERLAILSQREGEGEGIGTAREVRQVMGNRIDALRRENQALRDFAVQQEEEFNQEAEASNKEFERVNRELAREGLMSMFFENELRRREKEQKIPAAEPLPPLAPLQLPEVLREQGFKLVTEMTDDEIRSKMRQYKNNPEKRAKYDAEMARRKPMEVPKSPKTIVLPASPKPFNIAGQLVKVASPKPDVQQAQEEEPIIESALTRAVTEKIPPKRAVVPRTTSRGRTPPRAMEPVEDDTIDAGMATDVTVQYSSQEIQARNELKKSQLVPKKPKERQTEPVTIQESVNAELKNIPPSLPKRPAPKGKLAERLASQPPRTMSQETTLSEQEANKKETLRRASDLGVNLPSQPPTLSQRAMGLFSSKPVKFTPLKPTVETVPDTQPITPGKETTSLLKARVASAKQGGIRPKVQLQKRTEIANPLVEDLGRPQEADIRQAQEETPVTTELTRAVNLDILNRRQGVDIYNTELREYKSTKEQLPKSERQLEKLRLAALEREVRQIPKKAEQEASIPVMVGQALLDLQGSVSL